MVGYCSFISSSVDIFHEIFNGLVHDQISNDFLNGLEDVHFVFVYFFISASEIDCISPAGEKTFLPLNYANFNLRKKHTSKVVRGNHLVTFLQL